MRSAFPRFVPRVIVAALLLLTLCRCSFLFDLGSLDRGGPASPDNDATAGGSNDAQSPDETSDDGADSGPSEGGVDPTPEADTAFFDAAPDAFFDAAPDAFFDAAVDGDLIEAGPEAAAVDGGTADARPDASRPDATVDSGTEGGVDAAADAGGVDASADSGGLAAGLTALYLFDETSGTTSADSSGYKQTATMQGATFSAGLRNNAAAMDGTTQYVSLPAGIVSGLTAFSISAWVNLNAAAQHTHIFDFGTGTTMYMFLTPTSGSGALQFAITTTAVPGEQQLNGTAPLPTGSWQHVCVTLAGTTGTLYLNGAAVAKNAAMTLNPASLGNTTQNWLGRAQFTADPYMNGKIDELRIYARALTAAEVQQLFQQQL
ncbi:MAG TPA: LamG domain-containing protein [Polyangiaceae bacterium]|nr:LamG domain-containing protein [Polyangiaceae bacterium]